MKRITLALLSVMLLSASVSRARDYWHADADDNSITWEVQPGETHSDHVEMAGRRVATVLRYGVDSTGHFALNKSIIWPMLRTIPNDTHASLMRRYDWSGLDSARVDGEPIAGRVTEITFDGILTATSDVTMPEGKKLTMVRRCFPSATEPSVVETFTFINRGNSDITIDFPEVRQTAEMTDSSKSVYGAYEIIYETYHGGRKVLKPGEKAQFASTISAYRTDRREQRPISPAAEFADRRQLIDTLARNLILETPDTVIARMFAFAKLRGCESIYATKGGPMHGPGGEAYYAAIWANDQAEYINPFFPFTGYDYGNESALNSFRHFARYMNDEWKPIPSSIIAEGDGYWNGARDRGDAAMIAYGASRYLLARNDAAETVELWPLIKWCLEYNRRKLNADGTVDSDSDELEGRFPSGTANLCTSSLYYDALVSASYIAHELGDSLLSADYSSRAAELRKNIDRYFAATVEGFDTYAYYKGNDVLRSWICIPLTMGIDERAAGTVDALFSPRLWTENGVLTQAGDNTFWDRATLYALRGAYIAGATEKATDFLKSYSRTRLLGEHVPYAVEAWPEGGQRHLSAESGLYARVITEGLFGIRPTGFSSFTLTPRLPQEWDRMALRHIRAFGHDFDVEVKRLSNGNLGITLYLPGGRSAAWEVKPGETVSAAL